MKKIVRLTESDLVRLVKRVINEQMTISQKPYSPSVNVGGKTLKSGEKILVHNSNYEHNYYGTINEIELDGDMLTLTIDGGTVPSVDIDFSMEKRTEPMTEVEFGRKCLKITMPKPEYIDKVNFGKDVHVLGFDRLDRNYLRSKESACVSETQDEIRKNLGLSRIR